MVSLAVLRLALVIGSLALAGCITDVKRGSDPHTAVDGYVDESGSATDNPAKDVTAGPDRESPLREPGDVTLGATLGCPTYNERARECLLLKVDYLASTTPIVRPPLNIALVLDRSNFMRGDQKLAYALAVARGVIQHMTERDTLSIIAVNEQTTVLAAAGRVVNKAFLYHRLDDIFASGHADLSAGLLEGIAQVQRVSTESQVKHVLLLTDALAYRGRSASVDLQKSVRQASALGIAVSAFGLGGDHNGRLLAALAALGGGRYAYIKTPDLIATALNDVLHDPPPTVARDAAIRVTLTQGHIRKMYGQLPAPPTRSQILRIGDLHASERGFMLVELEPAAFAFGTTVEAEVRLDFVDPSTDRSQTREIRLRSSYAPDPERASLGGMSATAMLADVLTALEQADSAARGLDLESYRQIKASFKPLYERAHEYAVQNRDQELINQVFVLQHFMEELEAADKAGLLHGHEEARQQLRNERDYLYFLMTHHRQ